MSDSVVAETLFLACIYILYPMFYMYHVTGRNKVVLYIDTVRRLTVSNIDEKLDISMFIAHEIINIKKTFCKSKSSLRCSVPSTAYCL